LSPASRAWTEVGGVRNAASTLSVAHPVPQRRHAVLGVLGRVHGAFLVMDLVDLADLVAVDVEAALLQEQPVVETGMGAARADGLAAQVGDAVDAGVGARHQADVDRVHRLAEVDPVVATGAVGIGRDVVAADELDVTRGDLAVGIARRDLVVVLHVEPVLLPRSRFGDDVEEGKMGAGAIGEGDLVHDVLPEACGAFPGGRSGYFFKK
jgi:hypothetical protein